MINNDLEEDDGDFITHGDYPMEADIASIINILELLKQAAFINANKN